MRRAVFLDRDGTLVRDLGYPCHYDRASLFSFTAETLKRLRSSGFLLVLVTNQSCVARGLCTREQIEAFHRDLCSHLEEENAGLDAVYACYYYEGGRVAPWNRAHPWRKPSPGMLLQAAQDLGIDLSRSFMVGDKLSDVEAGQRAGCRTVLLSGAPPVPPPSPVVPDHTAGDLSEASDWILSLPR